MEDARSFIGYLDAGLEGWMRRWNELDTLLMNPLVETALDHIEREKSVELQR
ncbi:hypothetical protein [Microbacterium sp. BF1]|uniref:hypothetical protein n=1 Tax=Microbacterium sp. BF1 TaxID=2821146 RepID=UPI001C4DF555|nr:hypothetical protein [Microbacterium sp. BF1]